MINSNYEELASYTNAYQNKMEMGREVIADKGIWTAKKRYILNVHDSEGVRFKTPKLKMMGIETAKSSTPMWCRKKLEEGIRTLMNGTENDVWDFISLVWESPCILSITTVQDLLELDKKARFNIPGTQKGNWTWRLDDLKELEKTIENLKSLNEKNSRII